MITITNTRYEGHVGGYSYDPVTRKETPAQAFTSLVKFELGFGGRVVQIEPSRIVVATHIFGKVDLVEFIGPDHEMKILMMAVALYTAIRSHRDTQEILANRLLELTNGDTLLVAIGFEVLTHSPVIRVVASVLTCRTQEEANVLSGIKDEKDFFAAVELCLEGYSPLQVKELL